MRAETSKQAENISSQLIRTITEGKRKEESDGLALSLQDVFSDSANLKGMQQKTSCQSDTGQEKKAQLQKKEIIEGYKKALEGGKSYYQIREGQQSSRFM